MTVPAAGRIVAEGSPDTLGHPEGVATTVPGPGLHWRHLGWLVVWTVIGLLVALRRFRWDPRA